jgi:hypothetical protein
MPAPDEDEILIRELRDRAARAGASEAAAGLAARLLKKNVYETTVTVSGGVQLAVDRAQQVLRDEGRLLATEPAADRSATKIVGIVKAGGWNKNPAVITLTITPAEIGTQVQIRGAAAEGLIKQRAGEAAAKRVAAALA